MWLLGNAWKFLRQIWCDCLAGLCSLMGWFWLKLLHVYEIGIMPNFKFGFCNYTWNPCGYPHRYVCYVMLHSEQLLPNLLKRWKLSSEKLISKRIHVRGLSLNRQQSLKLVIVGQSSANSWERWTCRKRITACETACMHQLFAPFLAYCYRFWALWPIMHINTFTCQFYGVQLPVFFQ